jgi:hypothetical protein
MRRSRDEWADVIAEFEAGGESHEEFCAGRDLNVGSFRGWLYRLRRERAHGKVARSATRMVPVHVRAGSEPSDDVIEIAIPGVVLRVRAGVDVKYVAELAAALTRRC